MKNLYTDNPEIYEWACKLFPVNRSITGKGVRTTLNFFKTHVPNLSIKSVPSGTQCFDWTIPNEWNVKRAYFEDSEGKRYCDFSLNNLHLVGYSSPINKVVKFKELNDHLFSLPSQETAIPYVTSYYEDNWGFCITEKDRRELPKSDYKVVIDSSLKPGNLNYGELIISGKSEKEIFISTYICHPSMANNELSGPLVTLSLCKWLLEQSDLYYTYRLIFIPETIGAICYLSKNLYKMKKHVIAGFNITCVGDERAYSFLPSKRGNTLADQASLITLNGLGIKFKKYNWQERGSDERQYCSPGVDLPVASVMRSKYGEYPEYHTSLDNLDLISKNGLNKSLLIYKEIISSLEKNWCPQSNQLCEPFMSKYDLYPKISHKGSAQSVSLMMDIISLSDGKTSLIEIAGHLNITGTEVFKICEVLVEKKILTFGSRAYE